MNLKNKILQNIEVNELTGCWIWQLHTDRDGYGRTKVNGKKKGAHRIAYEAFNGPIPKGLLCCHHCDNPICCNPSHLFLGTNKDNMDDMRRKGRQGDPHIPHPKMRGSHPGMHIPHPNARGPHPNADMKGSKGPNAKLTEKEVVEIRNLLATGIVQRIIAEKFDVAQTTISFINLNKTWNNN